MLEHTSGFRIWHTADFTVATPRPTLPTYHPLHPKRSMVVTETTYGSFELPSRKSRTATLSLRSEGTWRGRPGARAHLRTSRFDVLLTSAPTGRTHLPDGLTRDTRLSRRCPSTCHLGRCRTSSRTAPTLFRPQVTLVERTREHIIQPHSRSSWRAVDALTGRVTALRQHVPCETQSAVLIVGYQDAESAGRQL